MNLRNKIEKLLRRGQLVAPGNSLPADIQPQDANLSEIGAKIAKLQAEENERINLSRIREQEIREKAEHLARIALLEKQQQEIERNAQMDNLQQTTDPIFKPLFEDINKQYADRRGKTTILKRNSEGIISYRILWEAGSYNTTFLSQGGDSGDMYYPVNVTEFKTLKVEIDLLRKTKLFGIKASNSITRDGLDHFSEQFGPEFDLSDRQFDDTFPELVFALLKSPKSKFSISKYIPSTNRRKR